MNLLRKCSHVWVGLVITVLFTSSLLAGPLLKPGQRFVFLGDSITQQRIYSRYVMNTFTMRYPGSTFSFRNAGIGGDQASWAVDRIDRDVLSLKPDVVSILFGVNDVGYKPFTQEAFDAYINGLRQITQKLKIAGVRVVLLTPTAVDDDVNTGFKPFLNEALAKFRDGVLQLALDEKCAVFDLYALMFDIQKRAKADNPKFTMHPDSVHPNDQGHAIITYSLIQALGGFEQPSVLDIDASSKRYRAEGCRLSGLSVSDRNVAFTRTDDALPVWFDEDVAPIYKYLPALRANNRYLFKASGIQAGTWRLTVQNTVIGSFTNEQIAAGLDLSDYDGPWRRMGKSVNAITQAQEDAFLSNWRVSREQLVEPVFSKTQTEAIRHDMDGFVQALETARQTAVSSRSWRWVLEKQ